MAIAAVRADCGSPPLRGADGFWHLSLAVWPGNAVLRTPSHARGNRPAGPAEFCGACHKQHVDREVNTDIGKVQGQNQYDSWKNSRWFHAGDPAKTVGCRECHLPLVDSTDPAREELTKPVVLASRSHAGFDPASGLNVRLFGAVLDGDHLVRGFRNADIREALFGLTEDAGERRGQSHAVGRMLKRLHLRGMIAKVPHSRRWQVSRKGHQLLGAVVPPYHYRLPATITRAA